MSNDIFEASVGIAAPHPHFADGIETPDQVRGEVYQMFYRVGIFPSVFTAPHPDERVSIRCLHPASDGL